MKILGHIHTFNDEDVIDRCLQSLINQTVVLKEIVIVDNGSTDATLHQSFPSQVTIIRHHLNLGTSGAVISGFQYALEKGYDWIWTFDADSAPRPDALEKLIAFYNSLSSAVQERIQRLASHPLDTSRFDGIRFIPDGYECVRTADGENAYQCDGVIWSGSLFNVEVIRKIGVPSADYVLDWAEYAYGYQAMLKGYTTYVVKSSVFDHNIGVHSPSQLQSIRCGPLRFRITSLPGIRLYYLIRNTIFFWCYVYHSHTYRFYYRFTIEFLWIPKYMLKLLLLRKWTELSACYRGISDGVLKRMHRRYS